MLIVKRIVNTPVTSNCFVVYDKAVSSECIIVDPGTKDNEELLAFVSEQELSPVYIILTHEHFDHCWGVNSLVEKYETPIVCSHLCSEAIQYAKRNCSVFYDNSDAFTIDSKTISVESLGMSLSFLNKGIHFYTTPGHSKASICFLLGHSLFTGDTLIKDERTITKLPTSSVVQLKESLKCLKGMQGKGYVVYPGHGDVFELDGYDINNAL